MKVYRLRNSCERLVVAIIKPIYEPTQEHKKITIALNMSRLEQSRSERLDECKRGGKPAAPMFSSMTIDNQKPIRVK